MKLVPTRFWEQWTGKTGAMKTIDFQLTLNVSSFYIKRCFETLMLGIPDADRNKCLETPG